MLSIAGPLRLVYEHTEEYTLSQPQLGTFRDHIERISHVIGGVENDLKSLRHQLVTVHDVSGHAKKLVTHTARLSSYYEQLQR